MKLKKALLVVDVQNDFCPKGALGVPEGDKIIPALNKYVQEFDKRNLPVFFTRDWHPKMTRHFKKYGGHWPVHCIQGTKGAQFHPKLKVPRNAIIISKGADPHHDGYSAFQAVDDNNAELEHLMKMFGVTDLYIGGLATDYCVKYSAIDALKKGFRIYVLADAIRGVNLQPGDSEKAMKEIRALGAKTVIFEKLKLDI